MFKGIKNFFSNKCGKCGAQKRVDSHFGLYKETICPYCEMGPSPIREPEHAGMTYKQIDEKYGRTRDEKIFP